jgi:hypothetical protein
MRHPRTGHGVPCPYGRAGGGGKTQPTENAGLAAIQFFTIQGLALWGRLAVSGPLGLSVGGG